MNLPSETPVTDGKILIRYKILLTIYISRGKIDDFHF